MRDFAQIQAAALRYQTAIDTKSVAISTPPGYTAGLDIRLYSDYTVSVFAGAANVRGTVVTLTADHQIVNEDWVAPQGNFSRHYFIYLTINAEVRVDIAEPLYSEAYLYYEHPTLGWRAIGRLFRAGGNNVFAGPGVYKDA